MRDTKYATKDEELRDRAIRRLKKKRDFHGHLLVYAMVNAFIIVIWAVTGGHFFWPIFPLVGWGIGVVMNAWDVYGGRSRTRTRSAARWS